MNHKQFLQAVVDFARLKKWMVYFTWDSRHSPAGFPDLILLRGKRQVVIEVKIPPDKVKPAQQEWLDAFEEAGAETFVVLPDGLDEMTEILE